MDRISLVRDGATLEARYIGDKGQLVTVDMSSFLPLESDGQALLESALRYVERVSARSAINYLRIVAQVGRTLERLAVVRLPSNEAGWQQLVLDIHESIILNPSSRATLWTRVTDILPTINTFLSHFQDEGIVPYGVRFPNILRHYKSFDNSTADSTLIGESKSATAPRDSGKLLLDISLSRTDAEYLDEVRDQLLARRKLLRECLLAYWRTLKAHVEYGRTAMAGVDKEDLESRLRNHQKACDSRSPHDLNSHAYCSTATERDLAEYLVVLKSRYGGIPTERQARADKAIPSLTPRHLPTIPELTLPFDQNENLENSFHFSILRIRWMLGQLSYRDIAVLSAIIIMEHPHFTPEAITGAKITDKKGHRNIEIGDAGDIFSVTKHRAKSQKRAALSELTMEIIDLCDNCTKDVRKDLERSNPRLSKILFLPFGSVGGKIITPRHENMATFLSGMRKSNQWLGLLFPSLISAGMDRGTISLSKIRSTEGVLEWFRTNSIQSMSRKIGNKTQTCIDHYIPRQLLKSWNTRLIRRFQNLWIVVAAADEDWLLEVTDFSTLEELHAFIIDMLENHDRFSSPLAAELHRRFRTDKNERVLLDSTDGAWLAICISKNSLAALFLYLEASLDPSVANFSNFDRCDSVTGVSPRNFVDLALLLQHMLPNDSDPSRRTVYKQAMDLVEKLRYRVHWREIMFTME